MPNTVLIRAPDYEHVSQSLRYAPTWCRHSRRGFGDV